MGVILGGSTDGFPICCRWNGRCGSGGVGHPDRVVRHHGLWAYARRKPAQPATPVAWTKSRGWRQPTARIV